MAKRSSRREARRAAKQGGDVAPGAAAAPEAAAPEVAAAPAPAADGPMMPTSSAEEQNLVSAFVQDKKGVALPSFDDFRRRDQTEEGRDQAVPPPLARAPRTSPEEQTAQEKLFELLTFDTID